MGIFSSRIGNAGEVSKEKLTEDYGDLLISNEEIQIGFKLIRDTFLFMNKRLIIIDKQVVTGKKTAYLSVLYKSISKYSIETSGTFDLDAELKIWISSEKEPSISKRINKSVNVYDVQKVLTELILN